MRRWLPRKRREKKEREGEEEEEQEEEEQHEEEEEREEEKEEQEKKKEREEEIEEQETEKEREEGWHIRLFLSSLQGAASYNANIPLWFQNLLCALWLPWASWQFSALSVCSQLLSGLSFLPRLSLQIPALNPSAVPPADRSGLI